ncbi:MAG: hypothetical protein NC489_22980 [Ruminococcus flavefaciens]|nr:hypothetical protein [Ruminococcus flavefaciens]
MIKITNIQYTLIISIIILLISIMIFISFIYYTKRKFDSINQYNKIVLNKLNSYKKNQKEYKKNIKNSGIKNEYVKNFILNVIKILKSVRGSE